MVAGVTMWERVVEPSQDLLADLEDGDGQQRGE